MYIVLLLLWTSGVLGSRLPETVIPYHYAIKLVPFFEGENFTFSGEVDIAVTAINDSYNITLSKSRLNITEAPFVRSLNDLQIIEVDHVDGMTLKLKKKLESGHKYVINIKFAGRIEHSSVALPGGIMAYPYRTTNNETRWLTEAALANYGSFAYRMFPCFDESKFKATFQLNIARPPGYQSTSNMPLYNTSGPDPSVNGRIWDSFYPTPVMSSEYVNFVVSDLKKLTSQDGKYSVLSKAQDAQAEYVLSVIPRLIEAMEQYTGIAYEIPKLDVLISPDIERNHPEPSWGLIRIMKLTDTDMDVSTARGKLNTLLATAQSIAELWFGCLVTAKMVPHATFLTHGFTNYLAYKISSKVEPEWNLYEQFVVDRNTYKLGNYGDDVIIRVLENLFTEETFSKAVRKYLKTYSHGVAVIDDFYQILNEQQKEDGILPDDQDVKTIIDSLIYNQYGMLALRPDVYVERVNGGIQVTQKLRLLKILRVLEIQENYTFWIPISYTTSEEPDFSSTKPKSWLEAERQKMILDKIDDDEWIILNLNATGFYSVNYDELTWPLLAEYLNSHHKDVPVLSRIQLLDDVFYFANIGDLSYTVAFDLCKYLDKETDPIVWQVFLRHFNFLKKTLQGADQFILFEEKVNAAIEKLYAYYKLYETRLTGKKLNHNVAMIQPQFESLMTAIQKKKQHSLASDVANQNN